MGQTTKFAPAFLAAVLFLCLSASGAATKLFWTGHVAASCALFVLGLLLLGATLCLQRIQFGWPELSLEQDLADAIRALPYAVFVAVAFFVVARLHPGQSPLTMWHLLQPVDFSLYFTTACFCRRGGIIVMAVARLSLGALYLSFGDDSHHFHWDAGRVGGYRSTNVNAALVAWSGVIPCVLACWTKYFMEHIHIFFLCFPFTMGILIDTVEDWTVPLSVVAYVCACIVMIYLVVEVLEHQRNLPPVFAGMKFIRMGFIRADGSRIARCQEMPACAFGDVGKSMKLISVSHRWLNQNTCDAPTPDFPMGLRLGTLRRELSLYFSPTRNEEPSFLRRLIHALTRRSAGGWDVVVFFDFSCLPQEPRSEEENFIFSQCLPHMGVLYSMFPTLILHEVTHGAHGYMESGWCFCEYQTAMLGKQVSAFSCNSAAALRQASLISVDHGDMESFIASAEAKLEQKVFKNASDAQVVRQILSGFALKRVLLDAIEAGDDELMRTTVTRMKSERLAHATLDQPVNKDLDTLLHVAVRKRNAVATRVLLDNGADASRRNYVGDTPSQLLMLPRFSRAAWLSRRTLLLKQVKQDEPQEDSA